MLCWVEHCLLSLLFGDSDIWRPLQLPKPYMLQVLVSVCVCSTIQHSECSSAHCMRTAQSSCRT